MLVRLFLYLINFLFYFEDFFCETFPKKCCHLVPKIGGIFIEKAGELKIVLGRQRLLQ